MSQHKANADTWMRKIATFVVEKRTIVFLFYIIAVIFSLFSMGWVNVENDVTKYLPEDTETRQGLDAMSENFVMFASARVMVSNVTYETAVELYDQIAEVPGVAMVVFDQTEDHYKNAAALFDVTFSGTAMEQATIDAMTQIRQALDGYDVHVDTTVGYDDNTMLRDEMSTILVVAVFIILTVLTLTSRSYAEIPVLLITFGVAALLNMGTNFIFDKIRRERSLIASLHPKHRRDKGGTHKDHYDHDIKPDLHPSFHRYQAFQFFSSVPHPARC